MKIKVIILNCIFLFFSCKSNENIQINENKKAKWIENAFMSLASNDYPKIKAISWWHENFENSLLKVNSSSKSLASYKNGINSTLFDVNPILVNNKLVASTSKIYHAAFPDFGGTEDDVSQVKISEFENLVGKEIIWAYFSNNFYEAIQFPTTSVNIINGSGKIPFIRMMPRSNFNEEVADPIYSMQKIINGDFDADLTQWAIDAATTETPLLVEFGTEVNGSWFSWNGQYNGAGETTNYGEDLVADGAERFRDAYRHIIDICNENGATNITWFFHVNAYGQPEEDWNAIQNYYPGDDYIDWLGVSVYGPQTNDEEYQEFSEILAHIYPKLINLSTKPIAILEFSMTEMD